MSSNRRCRSCRSNYDSAIEVLVDLRWHDVVVLGNPIQLERVFINLLTNARDAMATSPRKIILIAATLDDGIPPGLEHRILDPFFTTKEVGKGTGLGLSITYGIIKEHGGTISVTSSPCEGAEFILELPLASVDGTDDIES